MPFQPSEVNSLRPDLTEWKGGDRVADRSTGDRGNDSSTRWTY
jgi:hypothetical protein